MIIDQHVLRLTTCQQRRLPGGARQIRKPAARHGATLLDVAVGSMLLALLLIPSAHLISQSQSSNRRLANRETMLFEAENRLELTKVALSDTAAFDAAWLSATDVTSAAVVEDGPNLTTRARVSADRSLPSPTARLLTIVVDVWQDADGDGRLDAQEPSETIRTQWAAP